MLFSCIPCLLGGPLFGWDVGKDVQQVAYLVTLELAYRTVLWSPAASLNTFDLISCFPQHEVESLTICFPFDISSNMFPPSRNDLLLTHGSHPSFYTSNRDPNAPISIVPTSTGDQTVILIPRGPGAQPSHAQIHQQARSIPDRGPGKYDMVQLRHHLNRDPTTVVGESAWKVVRRGRVGATERQADPVSPGDPLESRVAVLQIEIWVVAGVADDVSALETVEMRLTVFGLVRSGQRGQCGLHERQQDEQESEKACRRKDCHGVWRYSVLKDSMSLSLRVCSIMEVDVQELKAGCSGQ